MAKATQTNGQDSNSKLNLAKVDTHKAILTGSHSNDDLLDAADELDASAFEDAGAEYLELGEGETKTLILESVDAEFEGDKGKMPAVILLGKENKRYIFAGTAAVNQCKRVAEKSLPCIVRFIHKGMKKSSKNGKDYADIEVRYLKPLNEA